MLVKRNLIDINIVEDLFYQGIVWYWEHIFPVIQFARMNLDPTQYDSFEYSYKEMKQRQQATEIT